MTGTAAPAHVSFHGLAGRAIVTAVGLIGALALRASARSSPPRARLERSPTRSSQSCRSASPRAARSRTCSDADINRELDIYAAARATWLRAGHALVEHGAGQGQLQLVALGQDRGAMSRSRGIQRSRHPGLRAVVGVRLSDDKVPPRNAARLRLVRRRGGLRHFAGQVAAYEIWNEPNVSAFWSPTPSTAAYVNLLKAAYPAIKAADPSAVVLAGAMCPAYDTATTIGPPPSPSQIMPWAARPTSTRCRCTRTASPPCHRTPRRREWNTFQRVLQIRTTMVEQRRRREADLVDRVRRPDRDAPRRRHRVLPVGPHHRRIPLRPQPRLHRSALHLLRA